jgi:hypothetical protein
VTLKFKAEERKAPGDGRFWIGFFLELRGQRGDEGEASSYAMLARYVAYGMDVEDAGVLRGHEHEAPSTTSRSVQMLDAYQGK